MPFASTKRIIENYYPPEEFDLLIVYGPLGYGKSSYSIKVGVEVLQEVYEVSEQEAWELIKQFIVFHPRQFFEKIRQVENTVDKRVPFLIWDDAGLWLYALDWTDPFVAAVGKYLNVARTHLASLICTTPLPTWIVKKLRNFPQSFTIKIIKETGMPGEDRWRRIAKAYRSWVTPDMKRSGVKLVYQDYFKCKLPTKFYWDWYKPLRDAYEDMALALMQERWQKIESKAKEILLEQYPHLKVPKLNLECTDKCAYKRREKAGKNVDFTLQSNVK